MKYNINKTDILEESVKIPKLSRDLNLLMSKLKKDNPTINSALIIASDDTHPLGGGSQLYFKNKKKSKQSKDMVYQLDEYFKKLKLNNGISIEHDWKKDGYKNLNKGLR